MTKRVVWTEEEVAEMATKLIPLRITRFFEQPIGLLHSVQNQWTEERRRYLTTTANLSQAFCDSVNAAGRKYKEDKEFAEAEVIRLTAMLESAQNTIAELKKVPAIESMSAEALRAKAAEKDAQIATRTRTTFEQALARLVKIEQFVQRFQQIVTPPAPPPAPPAPAKPTVKPAVTKIIVPCLPTKKFTELTNAVNKTLAEQKRAGAIELIYISGSESRTFTCSANAVLATNFVDSGTVKRCKSVYAVVEQVSGSCSMWHNAVFDVEDKVLRKVTFYGRYEPGT